MLWSLNAEIAESSPRHQHEIFEFVLCRGSGGRLFTDDGEIEFRSSRTILVPPNIPHRFSFGEGEIGRLKIVCAPPEDLPRYLSPTQVALVNGLGAAGVTMADHPDKELCLSQLSDMITDGFGNDDVRTEQLKWSAANLLLALHAQARHLAQDHSVYRHRGKIQDIVTWIENNLKEDLTIEQAASLFGLSRSLLTREFRLHTGRSFVDYCNVRRVQKAATLLVTEFGSVTQAALESGFSNLSHFHRQFKMYFGLTPAAFRRKVAEDGGLSFRL
ncbi:AraC family transcriptional regulator [Sodalis sp. dw_96]|uniref:AraC family transcriptional regulator n=1 Tax=Sodalis sp. dw_96 TaxID=2719794 RepID=UPI001BD1DEBF|nr:AraC family transcriptional regulator [Sodalis sp. dw_96]